MNRHCILFNDNQLNARRASGAYRVANLLERLGWTVDVIDWTKSWPEDKLYEYLDNIVNDNTVMFGFSYTWMKPEWTQNFIVNLKQRYPGRKFIAGGQQFYQYDIGCDAMLYGYSEMVIECVLEWFFDNAPAPKGTRPLGLGGGLLIDCNSTYPAMGLEEYSVQYTPKDYVQSNEQLTIEISRGCKFACKYCNYAFLGIKEDTSTCEQSLRNELMENYNKWGVTNYVIADDTLNDRETKLEMLARVVESLPFEPNFSAFVRIDLVISKPQQMEMLSRARVWAHFYGVETFHPAAGKAVGKGMSPDRIKQGLMDMRKHMMDTLGLYRGTLGMIAGLPHETPDSWQTSEDWLRDNWSDQCWYWWPLEISTDTNTLTTSVFSREWKKHGYRSITDEDEINEIDSKFNKSKTNVQHKFDNNSLVWTADWADINDATEFCSQFQDPTNFHRTEKKLSNFTVLGYNQKYSNDTLLELDERDILYDPKDVIHKYIINKSSL
jgi:hypothetical protein